MSLSHDLALVSQLFDIERVAHEKPDMHKINQYYNWTNWFYRQFHSKEGAMHFPLYLPNRANNHAEGLAEQAQIILSQIKDCKAENIAEIGCGSGYNLRTLARLYPQASYQGIDATPLHIQQARRYAKKMHVQNIVFQQGYFSRLPLEPNSIDVVFAVESFCYSQDLKHDLTEVARVLRKGGKFIIFDVFLQPNFYHSSYALQLASRLTAIGFAVADWDSLLDLKACSSEVGLEATVIEDLHTTLQPNLIRFQQDARRLFQRTRLLRLLRHCRILPAHLLKHAMTGLLAPYTMSQDVQGYFKIILEKR